MPALERQVASSIHLNFLTPVVMLMPKADKQVNDKDDKESKEVSR